LALLCWYLAAAVMGGHARKVFFVNGGNKPYAVAVNGQDHTLPVGGALPVEIPEGDVQIEFRDPRMKLQPITLHIETPFFSRPFLSRTFVVNPDQLAVLLVEETEYSEQPRQGQMPHELHVGELLYAVDGITYEFAEFPPTVPIKKGQTVRKSRIALVPVRDVQQRIGLVMKFLDPARQIEYAKRWLAQSPEDSLFLYWLLGNLPPANAIAFLTPHLADRPIRFDWHRAYQALMERNHPNRDLQPEYQNLVAESHEQPDALCLLARLVDLDEGTKLYERAAKATPPSVHALHGLGWRAMAQGQFAEAAKVLAMAARLAPGDLLLKRDYESALLANKQYDQLVAELAAGGGPQDVSVLLAQLSVQAAQGNKAKIDETIQRLRQLMQSPQNATFRANVDLGIEMALCLAANNVAGYLAQAAKTPDLAPFWPVFLKNELDEAAKKVEDADEETVRIRHALLYLAARKRGQGALADQQWPLFLADLA
jgi:hypothetical protein